jgi:probable HAF family extracellular repeat protein
MKSFGVAIASLGFSMLLHGTAIAQTYSVIDLGTLGGTASRANGVDASGRVTGESSLLGDTASHAFIYSNGVMIDLGILPSGGDGSQGSGINDAGQVTGWALSPGSTSFRAFLSTGGVMIDLGTLGGNNSFGFGINTAGQITGYADTISSFTDPRYHAFIYQNGVMIDMGTLGGNYSLGRGINAAGDVTGTAGLAGDTAFHAFIYSGGVMTDLGTLPGGAGSIGQSINAFGQVTGEAFTAGGDQHAFLYSGGVMSDLGTLGGTISTGHGINGSGQVVGESFIVGNAAVHGFLYSGGVMTDLNTLIPPGSGWVIVAARAINDAGQIAGLASFEGGEGRAVLLNPVNGTYAARIEQPINPDGSSVFKAKGVIPVKFSLTLNGAQHCDLPSAKMSVTRTVGTTTGLLAEGTYLMPAEDGSHFRVTGCNYHYNLRGSTMGAGTYRVDVNASDIGNIGSASFVIK